MVGLNFFDAGQCTFYSLQVYHVPVAGYVGDLNSFVVIEKAARRRPILLLILASKCDGTHRLRQVLLNSVKNTGILEVEGRPELYLVGTRQEHVLDIATR